MSVLIDKNTRAIVQGITGHQGHLHTKEMLEFGTRVVGGVTPGKGGQEVEGIPVFNSVKESMAHEKANWSIIFVPAPFARDAALEAMDAGLHVVVITEHVPVKDAIEIVEMSRKKKLHLIGPNCPGLATPGECKLGILPKQVFIDGPVGVVSRSGTLTYEIVAALTEAGIGQSTVIGIGGDPIVGTNFVDALALFEADDDTKQIVMVGEIGGGEEEAAANYIANHVTKPVVAYITGRTAPQGKTMGHAGAVISGNVGTAATKIDALKQAGVPVAELPSNVPELLQKV